MSESDRPSNNRWDGFFRILHRVNAVIIFGFVVFALFMTFREQMRAWERGYGSFANESAYGSDDSYSGREIETAEGQIVAYEADEYMDARAKLGANVSLTNMTTGESIQIAPEGYSVINWQLLERDGENEPRVAVGYLAFIADAEQFEQGRFELVVGTFPTLSRITVAQDILYGDLPTVHGDGSVALIVWAENDQAEFVLIDLASGEIVERRAVPLPRVGDNELSLRESRHIFAYDRNPVRMGSNVAPAPESEFGFVQW